MHAAADAIVIIGVAGSGKSTVGAALARQERRLFLDADDFHTADARAQMASGVPLTDAQREPWVASLGEAIRRHVLEGRSLVLAWSGLRAAHRQRLRASGVPMRLVFLDAAPSVLAARLSTRQGHYMGLALLASQLEALEDPAGEPDVITVDAARPPAQVVLRVMAALEAAPRPPAMAAPASGGH
jgi:gluconokinase